MSFQKESVLSETIFARITDIRVDNPDFIRDWANRRIRASSFTRNGKLNIVAADHPARGSVSVGNNPFEMADRHELLSRLVHILRSDWVDGVLGSMDILEELLILHGIFSEIGNTGFLDGKVLITSLNRGGIPGSVWELNDPVTGSNAELCKIYGIDAAKMLLRVDLNDDRSLQTILYCADAVTEFNKANLPMILEPLPVEKKERGFSVVKEADKLIPLVTMTSALGDSSRNIWLKIHYTDDFNRVTQATTLPIVILGGDRNSSIDDLKSDLRNAMNTSHQVRGAMFGRNILYPVQADPQELAAEMGKIVHGITT